MSRCVCFYVRGYYMCTGARWGRREWLVPWSWRKGLWATQLVLGSELGSCVRVTNTRNFWAISSPCIGCKRLLCLGGTVASASHVSVFSVEHLLTHTHLVFSKMSSFSFVHASTGSPDCSFWCAGVLCAVWMPWFECDMSPLAYVTEYLVPSWCRCSGRMWNLRNWVPAEGSESCLGMVGRKRCWSL